MSAKRAVAQRLTIVLIAVLALGLSAFRWHLVGQGPDPDTDAYAHHAIARQLILTPTNVSVHWVWLPLFHYLQTVIVLAHGSLQTMRYTNVVITALSLLLMHLWLLHRLQGHRQVLLVATLASIVYALSPIAMQMGSTGQPEPLFALVVLGFVILLVSLRREWPQSGQPNPRSMLFLGLSGLTTGLSWLCYYRALQSGPASLVAPLDKLSLPVAMLLAVLVLGERLTGYQWLGATLMTAGALLIAFV